MYRRLLWWFRYNNTNNNNNNNNNQRQKVSTTSDVIRSTFGTGIQLYDPKFLPSIILRLLKQNSIAIVLALLVVTASRFVSITGPTTGIDTNTTTTTLLSSTTTRGGLISSKSRYWVVSAWISPPHYPNNRSHLGSNQHFRSTAASSLSPSTTTAFVTVTTNHPFKRTLTTHEMSNSPEGVTATSTMMNKDKDIKQPLTFRDSLQQRIVNTWVQQLDPETDDNYQKSLLESRVSLTNNKNQTKRQVYNGHYVIVEPTPLPNPRLVLYSTDVAEQLLGFTLEQIHESNDNSTPNNDFIRFVAGHSIDGPASIPPGWATPYALSIMGTRYTNNCPYGTGNAYGDGRAISIAEISTQHSENDKDDITTPTTAPSSYELQLKGGGTTPFHRGADGRAVLRSSIREFLASEAMHYLGVPTTRALSLVVSTTATIQRPWYKDQIDTTNTFNTNDSSRSQQSRVPTIDDPRLAQYTIEQRKQIINQIRRQNKEDPDILITEPCAITCRVSPSFVRIGHLDLFARRAVKASLSTTAYNTDSLAWKELEKMIWHACYREYRADAYTPNIEQNDIAAAATVFLEQSAHRLANMVSQWIRVGFAQYVDVLYDCQLFRFSSLHNEN